MACGCSKTKKATAALLKSAASTSPAPVERRAKERRSSTAPRVKTRARFRVLPPPMSGDDPVIFSTLYEASRYRDEHDGWTMDIVREPVE